MDVDWDLKVSPTIELNGNKAVLGILDIGENILLSKSGPSLVVEEHRKLLVLTLQLPKGCDNTLLGFLMNLEFFGTGSGHFGFNLHKALFKFVLLRFVLLLQVLA